MEDLGREISDYHRFNAARERTSSSRTVKVLRRLFGSELQPSNAGKLKDYEVTFRQVTGSESGIADRLARISESGRKPAVLDLMSNGAFAQDLLAKGHEVDGLSVGLRTDEDTQKLQMSSTETSYVRGDIVDFDETWSEISKWLEKKGLTGFDLVVCRPIGAAEAIKGPRLYRELLNKMWKVANPDGGMILSEFSSTDELKNGAEKLKGDLQTKGVDMRVHKNPRIINSVIALVRNPKGPESII